MSEVFRELPSTKRLTKETLSQCDWNWTRSDQNFVWECQALDRHNWLETTHSLWGLCWCDWRKCNHRFCVGCWVCKSNSIEWNVAYDLFWSKQPEVTAALLDITMCSACIYRKHRWVAIYAEQLMQWPPHWLMKAHLKIAEYGACTGRFIYGMQIGHSQSFSARWWGSWDNYGKGQLIRGTIVSELLRFTHSKSYARGWRVWRKLVIIHGQKADYCRIASQCPWNLTQCISVFP